MDREHSKVGWSGQGAFVIGILPAASSEMANLEDPNTRDGWLRSKIRSEGELLVRGLCGQGIDPYRATRELGFLKEEFFAETGWEGSELTSVSQCSRCSVICC